MPSLFELASAITDTDTDSDTMTMTARIVPFGVEVPYGDRILTFARGEIRYPEAVPLSVDHARTVSARVGVMSRHFETDDGAYAEFRIADTQAGRELRELMLLEAVRDVSIGIYLDDDGPGGDLDHVSIVQRARFGAAADPSRVLSVHDERNPTMPAEPITIEPAAAPTEYDDAEIVADVADLAERVDRIDAAVTAEAPPPGTVGDFVRAVMLGDETEARRLAQFALASDTTTTAAGVVPDYLSSEILSIVDTTRPFVASFQNDPIGDAGMSVVYPEVTQKPAVGKQATENTEVASQAMTIATKSYDLETFAGANQVSLQLVERSQPSFVTALFRDFAGEYAIATEQEAVTVALAAITQTQLLADASADASATIAALAAANTQVIDGVRRPSTAVWCGSTRWEQFLSLVDSTGRPLVTWPGGEPSNAFGTADLASMEGRISGLRLRLVPNMGAEDMIQGWAGAAANLESSPQQLRALQVSTLAWELGVYGLYQFAVKYAAGFVKYTVA